MNDYEKKRIEKVKEQMKEELIEDSVEDGIIQEGDKKAIEELYSKYGEKENEYLVDGALLACDRAITEVKIVKGHPVGHNSIKPVDERKRTRLTIVEGATEVNGVRMATIKDREIDINIKPFECNCMYEPNDEEAQAILDDLENCKKYGTCRKLMKLKDDWENVIRNTEYCTYNHPGSSKEVEGITMLSMLFCSKGGMITPVDSGQQVRIYYKSEEIEKDIRDGLYTREDFNYLVATVAGEANTYEGMVAVTYEILNRCKEQGKSIREICMAPGQYTGFKSELVGVTPDDVVEGAVAAALRNEVDNPIGDITFHFGRVSGYDLWCEGNSCVEAIVIGEGPYRNVFFKPSGTVHNKQNDKTEDAIVIYDASEGKWLFDGEVMGQKNE